MEFNEKLQQLRKQNNMTQEQLAIKLYVSRTAVSKWESGKGWPNIESLKCISRVFSVSIDELLSSDELITIAETENRSGFRKMYRCLFGIIDAAAVAFIFLPLYGQPRDSHIYAVDLMSYTGQTKYNLLIYWSVFLAFIILGSAEFLLTRMEKEAAAGIVCRCSAVLGGLAVCLFAAARDPYVTVLLFFFFTSKVFLLVRQVPEKP